MKITSFSGDVKNISKLSDRPNIENGYTSDALKALFDKAGCDIKEYINSVLIEELASSADGMSGADKIGSGHIDLLDGDTVQEKLLELTSMIKELTNGIIPDGSVTPEKFDPEIANFLTSASIRANVFTEPGSYTFTVERAGTYKFTLVGGGAGGGVSPSDSYHQLGGGGGASAILWRDMAQGDVCTVTVGKGGKGLAVAGSLLQSVATAGEDTVLAINGGVAVTAQGAPFGLEVRAKAVGGTINYSGGYPKAGDSYGSTSPDIEFTIGGDSILGNGGAFDGDTAGIGGGGFAGSYHGSNVYRKGYDGGNGAVIIEYMK